MYIYSLRRRKESVHELVTMRINFPRDSALSNMEVHLNNQLYSYYSCIIMLNDLYIWSSPVTAAKYFSFRLKRSPTCYLNSLLNYLSSPGPGSMIQSDILETLSELITLEILSLSITKPLTKVLHKYILYDQLPRRYDCERDYERNCERDYNISTDEERSNYSIMKPHKGRGYKCKECNKCIDRETDHAYLCSFVPKCNECGTRIDCETEHLASCFLSPYYCETDDMIETKDTIPSLSDKYWIEVDKRREKSNLNSDLN